MGYEEITNTNVGFTTLTLVWDREDKYINFHHKEFSVVRIISVAITSSLEVLPHWHSEFMYFIFHGIFHFYISWHSPQCVQQKML